MKQFIERRFPVELPYGFLQLFAEGGEDDAGGGGGNSGGDGGNGGSGGGNSAGKGDKTFTQAELDAAVQRRVARAEKDAVTALAKELGFDSVEAMKASLKKSGDDGKGKDSQKPGDDPVDVEKLVRQQVDARLKDEQEKTFKRLLTAEVKVVANELGFADWEDALKLADLSGAKENDKGEIEGVREALEKLAQAKPHLLKTKPASGRFGADIRGGSAQQDERKKRLEHFAKLAQSRGSAPDGAYDPWNPKKD